MLAWHPEALQMDGFGRANAVGVIFHSFAHVGPTAKVEYYLRGVHIRCLQALRQHLRHFHIGRFQGAAELLEARFECAFLQDVGEVLIELDSGSTLNEAVGGGGNDLVIDVASYAEGGIPDGIRQAFV